MGCDIHLHEEFKAGGEWYHYSAPDIERDYDLFAKMAGVRGDHTPIAKPKGLPADISRVTKMDYHRYGPDAHDESWFGPEEIVELDEWLRRHKAPDQPWWPEHKYYDMFFGSTFRGFHEYGIVGTSIPEEVEDVRFVFWFDN